MIRTPEQMRAIIASISYHARIYTSGNPYVCTHLSSLNVEAEIATHAAISQMIQHGCTYLAISLNLNLTYPQIHYHREAAINMKCTFFEAAQQCYYKAGIEALQKLQTKQPA